MPSDLENAHETFTNAGLAFPTIPEELASKLVKYGKWVYSSKPLQLSPYNFHEYAHEAEQDHLEDYVLLAHSGHGINSFAIQYYLVQGPLRMLVHLGYGGAYMNAKQDAGRIQECFAMADKIVVASQKERRIPTGERLLVAASGFYGGYCEPPGTTAEQKAQNRKSTGLVKPERVLQAALDWLAEQPAPFPENDFRDPGPTPTVSQPCHTQCLYNIEVAFEWDPDKAESNFRKHGIMFSTEAEGVFDDDFALTVTDDESDPAEQRFVTLGMGTKGEILVVVYTYRDENIRIISARPAEPQERQQYQEQR